MSLLARLFGLENATESGLHIAKMLAVLLPAFAASFQISTTFWMIFIAESLGGGDYITGLTLVGILVVVQLGIQTAFDYPTGAVGDWIGQRFIIATALICYGIAFWLTSIVTPSTPFPIFLAIYALMGLGAAQESGAFNAWFDNNYRVAMPQDADRKQYGVFWGKIGMLWQVISTLVLLPGSFLALLFGRPWVFQVQAIFSIVLAILVLRVIKDLPGVREMRKERASLREYGSLLKDGFKFVGSHRFVTFTIFGEILIWATGALWWNLILFPLYFSYLLTDLAVSGFRTTIFIPEAMIQERSGIWSKRFDPVKWIPRFRLLQFCGFIFFVSLALITFLFPPQFSSSIIITFYIPLTNTIFFQLPLESFIPVILIFIVFLITDLFGSFAGILTQRVMIDVIPTRIRNSMYSLYPTLAMLCAIPLLLLFGWLLPIYKFPPTFILVSLVALAGTLLIRKGYSYPIPKAKDLAMEIKAESEELEEETKEIGEVEEIPSLVEKITKEGVP